MMVMMTLPLMVVHNLVILMMDMLALEDQFLIQIHALFVQQLEEVYRVIKEVESLFEVMDSNMNQSNEKVVMKILVMVAVKHALLKKDMFVLEDLFQELTHAPIVLIFENHPMMIKTLALLNEEME